MKVIDSRKFLVLGALLFVATLAVHGASSKDTAFVRDVKFNDNGESLEVKITTSESSKFTYFELNNPHRLVIDFHGSSSYVGFSERKIDRAGVERVRTSLFKDKDRTAARIVFDLASPARYRVI